MRTTTIIPRPDQISELTRGVLLPLPEIHVLHLEFIAETIGHAFEYVRIHQPQTIATGSETEITALLEAKLNNMIDEDILWKQLVNSVVRGRESTSYDGAHLEKRPDISIYLTDRNRNFPLIVEAKIIDSPTGKTEKLYCDKGIQRFIDGDYAWATKEAFMLAYVRDKSTIGTKLTPFFLKGKPLGKVKYAVAELPKAQHSSNDLACSKHSRSFFYPNPNLQKDTPGVIILWHLWVS